jgi:hypothetical protein
LKFAREAITIEVAFDVVDGHRLSAWANAVLSEQEFLLMSRSIALLVAVLMSLWAAPLPAQDFALGQKYGRGVHA